MSKSVFDLIGNLDTLLAVAVGAILATTGALFAELVQDRLNRKRREREAARFFGEVMSSMDRILEAALRSQQIGDAWGPVTSRLFRTSLREAHVYERNRERLFDIRDMALRQRIHTHMVTKTFPVDAIIEYGTDMAEIEDTLNGGDETLTPQRRERLEARAALIDSARQNALDAITTELSKTEELCTDLEKLAGVKFGEIARPTAVSVSSTEDQGNP